MRISITVNPFTSRKKRKNGTSLVEMRSHSRDERMASVVDLNAVFCSQEELPSEEKSLSLKLLL